MKNDLVITDRKVVNLTAFRKTIGLKVVPLFFSCIFFVKIDVKKDTLISRLFNNACVIFVNGCNVEELKYALGKKVTCQNLIVKC